MIIDIEGLPAVLEQYAGRRIEFRVSRRKRNTVAFEIALSGGRVIWSSYEVDLRTTETISLVDCFFAGKAEEEEALVAADPSYNSEGWSLRKIFADAAAIKRERLANEIDDRSLGQKQQKQAVEAIVERMEKVAANAAVAVVEDVVMKRIDRAIIKATEKATNKVFLFNLEQKLARMTPAQIERILFGHGGKKTTKRTARK